MIDSSSSATASHRSIERWFAVAFVLIAWTQPGCIGLVSNLMHAVGADMIPAESDSLKESKVAIITITDRSQYSDDITARLLSRKVAERLQPKVKEIKLVREDAIQQWRDSHGWDEIDFTEIGKGVKAEKVLGIEVTNMKLREGATLFRGRANVRLTVIDVATDEILYTKELDEFTYPQTAGQYTSETNEERFRKLYLSMLADRIARTFHKYDYNETIALDGALASQ